MRGHRGTESAGVVSKTGTALGPRKGTETRIWKGLSALVPARSSRPGSEADSTAERLEDGGRERADTRWRGTLCPRKGGSSAGRQHGRTRRTLSPGDIHQDGQTCIRHEDQASGSPKSDADGVAAWGGGGGTQQQAAGFQSNETSKLPGLLHTHPTLTCCVANKMCVK